MMGAKELTDAPAGGPDLHGDGVRRSRDRSVVGGFRRRRTPPPAPAPAAPGLLRVLGVLGIWWRCCPARSRYGARRVRRRVPGGGHALEAARSCAGLHPWHGGWAAARRAPRRRAGAERSGTAQRAGVASPGRDTRAERR